MSVELITYGSDRRLEIGAAEAIRSPIYLDDWTRIRIGLQCSMDGVASNIVGTPFFAFGVCNGSANVLAGASADHVVGMRFYSGAGTTPLATWTHVAGPPSYFGGLGNGCIPFKKVGSTITYSAGLTGFAPYMVNTPTQRSGLFFDIIKGSPNFTFEFGFPSNSTGVQSDLTDTQFQSIMELPDFSSIASVKANHGRVGPGASLAVDEGTNGALDHVFVYWERTTHKFSFNIRHRKIA